MTPAERAALRTEGYVVGLLKARCVAAGGIQQAADLMGMKESVIRACLKGRRSPKGQVAEALGWRPVTVYLPLNGKGDQVLASLRALVYANQERASDRDPVSEAAFRVAFAPPETAPEEG